MERRYIDEILGKEVLIWTSQGLKYQGKNLWIDSVSICLMDSIKKSKIYVFFSSISTIKPLEETI
jgi:hypothetical protein